MNEKRLKQLIGSFSLACAGVVLLSAAPVSSGWAASASGGGHAAAHGEQQTQGIPSVAVRVSQQVNYSRIVFDWPFLVTYDADMSRPDRISIHFDKLGDIQSDVSVELLKSVISISPLPPSGEGATVNVEVLEGAKYRAFRIGNRIVLDVYDVPGKMKPSAMAKPQPQKPRTPEKVAEKPKEAVPETVTLDGAVTGKASTQMADKPVVVEKPQAPDEKQLNASQEAEQNAAPKEEMAQEEEGGQTVLEQALAEEDAHVITISATEKVGLASFIRNGWLWIVMDRTDLRVPPVLSGPQQDQFDGFEQINLQDGIAYRLKLPDDLTFNLYGEGGGLVWRLILTPNQRGLRPINIKRIFTKEDDVMGGTLIWRISGHTKLLDVTDPETGEVMKVVTVDRSDVHSGEAHDFTAFRSIVTPVGLVIIPKVDDLKLAFRATSIDISRDRGLAISRKEDLSVKNAREVKAGNISAEVGVIPLAMEVKDTEKIFHFNKWILGGLRSLDRNQHTIMSSLLDKDVNGQVQDMLTIAKMNLSNGRGQEARGFLSYALQLLPELAKSPEYLALRGAANAIAGKHELALRLFLQPSLQNIQELDYWRAYTLASLEDWQQAIDILPDDFSGIAEYPLPILERIGIKLAEVALRNGDVEKAEGLLALLNRRRDEVRETTLYGIRYLYGEANRQNGLHAKAREYWVPLTVEKDDFYRARAGLALTMLELDDSRISKDEAIDRLEGLRYAWRGDELEAKVNFLLGKLYLEKGRYLKAFTIMRDATTMSPDTEISRQITVDMGQRFFDLLMYDDTLSPLDAVRVYEEFKELTPPGPEGNVLSQRLADRLVSADLITRAASILQHLVDHRLKGEEQARVATKLASVYLLDRQAGPALKSVRLAQSYYSRFLKDEDQRKAMAETYMLEARALSLIGRTEEAVDILDKLEPSNEISLLRADIAWRAGLWADAGIAFKNLILDEDMDLMVPLNARQARLILNRAVALNLAGDRVELTNMRKKYGKAMEKTPQATLFEVVTRPRKTNIVTNADTIKALVDEVDMFQDFLKTFSIKDMDGGKEGMAEDDAADSTELQGAEPASN